MLLVWIVGAVAAVALCRHCPVSPRTTTRSSCPPTPASSQAADLAKPFGTSELIPVPVVAAGPSGTLTPADTAALTSLQAS